ncbi:Bardet-Biedl syndrome 7 protein homolog [Tribolium madens]|uniref:Bardet-Biedl syndrome 7 protein homolog n=1 Tax=Tribolium madens TaxID=41895 RepID=UPI001CF72DDA|nr:Bardet-Biedl syndrome 7 protein homolog [Tribolium madens]
MELELSRVDYTIVGITSQNCLKLLPPSVSKEPQKVAVADSDGILQIFSVKKEDIQLHFKTLPGPKISSLQLGGAHGSSSDKIFIAAENEVRGYTKKGKLFLTFDSGMTETVLSMFVLGNDLFLCGRHIYNHYRDCKDVGSYLCGDQIVDVIAFYADRTRRLMSLIACEGRMIRALEHARVTLSMEVESAPTLLHVLEQEGTKTVLFGTVDGRIGILDVEKLHGFDRWLIDNSSNSSTISCVDTYDMTSGGTKNLILGRQDGTIEVYVINVNDKLDSSVLIYSHVSTTGLDRFIDPFSRRQKPINKTFKPVLHDQDQCHYHFFPTELQRKYFITAVWGHRNPRFRRDLGGNLHRTHFWPHY